MPLPGDGAPTGTIEPGLVTLFGPTAVGKTSIAVELADRLRECGESPVAINCDSIQVYRGLEILSGAPTADERASLDHRFVSFVPIDQEYSAGQFAADAHDEIDRLSGHGHRPLLVGGTGLYLRAAISNLEFRPPVPPEVRQEVERDLAALGPSVLHARLPGNLRSQVHPNDRKRIGRFTELIHLGVDPAPDTSGGGLLWEAPPRRPTLVLGITADRGELDARISSRVERMVEAGVYGEVTKADAAGASRTARAAIGFREFLAGDIEAAVSRQRSFARRQLTWMRKLRDIRLIDRTNRSDSDVAADMAALLREWEG